MESTESPIVEEVSTCPPPAVAEITPDNIDDTLSDSDLKKIMESFTIYDRISEPAKPTPSAADLYVSKMTGPTISYYDAIDDYNSRLQSFETKPQDYSYNDYESSVGEQMHEITSSIGKIEHYIADIASGGATIEESLTATNMLLDKIAKTQAAKNALFETKLSNLEETQRIILERLADLTTHIKMISSELMKL